ncbi:MAG: serine/threonine protein kinase, partial [Planctomycetales bacterium]|nr:serine/threonine protein kinase [Planctomycetales bacterium]
MTSIDPTSDFPENSQRDSRERDLDAVEEEHLPRRMGNYELLARLGSGGMGVVYRARQLGLDRVVALKTIRSESVGSAEHMRRFHSEIRAVAKLNHPGIVPLLEVGQVDGYSYYSMPLMEGGTLSLQLVRGDLPFALAAERAMQLAKAVTHAHKHGIIHRDLKPDNVLLDNHGQVKLTDFGIAKLADATQGATSTGQIVGTAGYMAPEQARGDGLAISELTDVYGLGGILYSMLTGKAPFQSFSPVATIQLVLHKDPIAPRRTRPAIPRDLETICLKCLEKTPGRRYPTASHLAEDLQRFLDGKPIVARRPHVLRRAWLWCFRHQVASVAIVAVVALAVAFAKIDALNRYAHSLSSWLLHQQQPHTRNVRQQLWASLDHRCSDVNMAFKDHVLVPDEKAWNDDIWFIATWAVVKTESQDWEAAAGLWADLCVRLETSIERSRNGRTHAAYLQLSRASCLTLLSQAQSKVGDLQQAANNRQAAERVLREVLELAKAGEHADRQDDHGQSVLAIAQRMLANLYLDDAMNTGSLASLKNAAGQLSLQEGSTLSDETARVVVTPDGLLLDRGEDAVEMDEIKAVQELWTATRDALATDAVDDDIRRGSREMLARAEQIIKKSPAPAQAYGILAACEYQHSRLLLDDSRRDRSTRRAAVAVCIHAINHQWQALSL